MANDWLQPEVVNTILGSFIGTLIAVILLASIFALRDRLLVRNMKRAEKVKEMEYMLSRKSEKMAMDAQLNIRGITGVSPKP